MTATPPSTSKRTTRTHAPAGTDHPDFPREAQHLDLTVRTMARRILNLEDGLRDVGADEDTAFIQTLDNQSEADELSLHLRQPYFGSMVVRAGGRLTRLYLSRYPFYDPAGQCTTTDWRSPVGQLFYTDGTDWQTPRGRGEVLLKRQLDVRERKLTGLTDLYMRPGAEDAAGLAVDPNATREQAAAAQAALGQAASGEGREAVLLRRLNEAATGGMRDIIATIQPEQDALIRADGRAPLVVQGPAGSGKTSVAFHRAAYLAFRDRDERERIEPHASLVLMPNRVLADFAARVLPDLGLTGLPIGTPENWMLEQLGLEGKVAVVDRTLMLLLADTDRKLKATAWLRAKAAGDARMLDVVRAALHARFRERLARLMLRATVQLDAQHELQLGPDALLSALDAAAAEAARGEATTEGLRRVFEREVITLALAALGLEGPEVRLQLERQLKLDMDRLCTRAFSVDTPLNETRRLLTRPELLRGAAEGHLDPARINALCAEDPLLGVHVPTSALIAGGATAGRRMGWVDVLELPIALAVLSVTTGLGRRLTSARARYDHVIVDEAQDLSPLQYRLLREVTRTGAISTFGDASQGIHGYRGVSSWDQALAAMGGQAGSTRFLQRTYRSTRQIAELSGRVAASYARGESYLPEAVPREGREVQSLPGNEDAVARAVLDLQAAGHANVAVIRRRAHGCRELASALVQRDVDAAAIEDEAGRYRGGIVVLPVHLAKGLEFDAAVVVGADARNFPPDVEYESRLLYVAVTRGMHALTLVPQAEPHPLLAD